MRLQTLKPSQGQIKDQREKKKGKPKLMTSRAILILSLCATLGLLASSACKATDFVIYSTPTALLPGQTFSYDMTPRGLPYGPANLTMQPDCNLVSYYKDDRSFSSNTTGASENCYLTIDNYGSAVIRGNYHFPVWTSPVRGNISGEYILLLQWNGGLATYGPDIWSSTNKPLVGSNKISPNTLDYVFYSHSVLPAGQHILENNDFLLFLERNCNLVLRRKDTRAVLWQSHRYSDSGDCFVTLDAYGELFVKHKRREILWRSNSRSQYGEYVLVLRFDARLIIYGYRTWSSKPFWSICKAKASKKDVVGTYIIRLMCNNSSLAIINGKWGCGRPDMKQLDELVTGNIINGKWECERPDIYPPCDGDCAMHPPFLLNDCISVY